MASDKEHPTFTEIKAMFREVSDKFKETDAGFKEIRALFKQTDAKIANITSNIGGLSKKWGDLGEAMTVGESLALFNNIEGVEVHSLHPSIICNYDGKEYEIDGLAIGKDVVIVIEAKATLKKSDIGDFVNNKLKIFTKLEPDHEGKKIYGAMGFLSASAATQDFAQEKGLLLICPAATHKKLVSPKNFKPHNFHP